LQVVVAEVETKVVHHCLVVEVVLEGLEPLQEHLLDVTQQVQVL
jgi:hypothetical protein